MAVQSVFVRSPFNYDRDAVSKETSVSCEGDEVFTVQSEKENADINVIVARFGITGELPAAVRLPQYGDYTEIMDFQSAQDAIRKAQEGFNALPSAVRSRFGNDPQAFFEFATNPEVSKEELVELGLASQAVADEVAAKRNASPAPPVPGSPSTPPPPVPAV